MVVDDDAGCEMKLFRQATQALHGIKFSKDLVIIHKAKKGKWELVKFSVAHEATHKGECRYAAGVRFSQAVAKDDMYSALGLAEISSPVNIQVCFHPQQSVEKSLKAYLVFHQIDFRWSHDIYYMLSLCLDTDNSFGAIKHIQKLT